MEKNSQSISMPATILLVDDHQLFRKGLRLLLEKEQDMSIVGEAGDGQEAIDKVMELSPDVVVMDITMPDMNGIEATRLILEESPETKVVALSIHSGKKFVQDMLSAGAMGYILKDSVPEELSNSIRKVVRGEVCLSNAITGVVVSEYVTLLSGDGKKRKDPTGEAEPADSGVANTATAIPIIKTKLYRPRIPEDHVHRQHLIDKLNRSVPLPLTVVTAAAGYGKSTLVSHWLENCEYQSSWLSLDENDNDLRQFFTYLVCAVRQLFPDAFHTSVSLLKVDNLPSSEILARQLITDIETIEQRFVLVLDDYHLIQSKVVHELLDEIIKHPPQAMHLVLVSRIDPPLPVAKLRAKGQLAEVRVRDLRFSREETAQFLQQMLKMNIEERIVTIFDEKSEGWITGLRLATLSLGHSDNIERVVANMPETNCYVLDYFVEEILSQQSKVMQDYLLATSVLDRFCGRLCDAVFISETVSGGDELNGQKFIQLLNKANLFVIRLDDEGRWFRYHHLFKSLLQRRSKQRFEPEDIIAIHTKASSWFADNNYFEEAIHHALAGVGIEKAAEIVGHARHDLMNKDQWHRLERWLKLFSHEDVQQSPHLIMLRSWLDLWHWYRLDDLVEDLKQTDFLLESSTIDTAEVVMITAEVAAIRSNFAYWMLKPSYGVDMAEQALRDSPDEHECTRSTAVFGLGPLHQMLGEVKQGEHILWSHMEDGRFKNPSSQARLLVSLGMTLWPESETRKLQQTASRLLQISLERELSWSHSFARYFLGLTHYEKNELNEAVVQLEIIVADPRRFPIQNVTHCSFLLSLSYQALGLEEQARKVAESITKLTFERGNQLFMGLAEAFQADLDLRQGRIAQADQWASAFTAPAPHGMHRFFNAELSFIKIMMARNTPLSLKTAVNQLDSLEKLFSEIHHRRLMIDTLGMQALLNDSLGQESTAFENLCQALALAEPGGFIRPMLDLGNQMGDLLKRLMEQKADIKYGEKILVAFQNEKTMVVPEVSDNDNVDRISLSNQTMVDPLTKREIEILMILSKRFTNPEIAEKLFISPETVKRHLYNIYQKFGVENRQQAIAKAKSIGIL